MQKIDEKELAQINGGMSVLAVIGTGLAITFISGVIDGIARPKKCHS